MSVDENKALVRHFYEKGWNKRNPAIVDEVWASDGIYSTGGTEIRGREAMKQRMLAVFATCPDFHQAIDDMIAEGDMVVVSWTAKGTHKGEWQGIAPTNKVLTWTGLECDRIADGKIVKMQREYDTLSFMRQIGAIS